MQSFIEKNEELPLPDLGNSYYLVSLLDEVGACMHSEAGVAPTTWQEIHSWLNCTGRNLSIWEIMTIKDMSYAYTSELSYASKKDRPAPYSPVVNTPAPDLDSKLSAFLRSFKKKGI